MNTNMRRSLTTVLAFAVLAVGTAVAQEVTERERQQQEERMREAERRVEEAQQQLEQAMRMLQERESRQAREQLQDAVSELNRAVRELDRDRFTRAFELYTDPGGSLAFALSSSGPKMGVYLSTERDASTDSIGAVLDEVVEDGPAAEAGLEAGDIIVSANGKPLARTSRRDTSPSSKLVGIKDELEVGDTLHVAYRRGSQTRTADIVLGEDERRTGWAYTVAPEISVLSRGVTVPNITYRPSRGVATVFSGLFWPSGWLEMELVELDEDLGAYFGTSEGLLVIRAPEDEDVEFRSGDVILNVDGRKPTDQAHLVRIMRSYEAGETMVIEIMRNRNHETVSITVPERDDVLNWSRRDERH
ncbi:MAG: PDZ domain-containing protein [Gemmatimonadota bacterium]|nr:MAG: PDZ domain-containing protein [Gemmatimonadota bacterium]